jgi:hypothetical protein
MPMTTNEDHGGNKPNNAYCKHCTDLDGRLLPFEKKYEEMVNFTMQTRWMSREEAERTVKEQLIQMPAWKERIVQLMPKPAQPPAQPTATPQN